MIITFLLCKITGVKVKRESKPKAAFHEAQLGRLLTAQVAFLGQGHAQVAVPPAKVVSQESREGQYAVISEPLLEIKTELWNRCSD